MQTYVTLIRHGETDWNTERRWQGFANTPLNENGRQQAQEAAKHLHLAKITRIVSSDLQRAHETASIIGKALQLAVSTDERLREINVGKWQGLTGDEIREQYPEEFARAQILPYLEMRFPGGESRAELGQRAIAMLNDLVKQAPGEHILVATHGGTIRMILNDLLKFKEEGRIHNCSITRLEHNSEHWKLIGFNQYAQVIPW